MSYYIHWSLRWRSWVWTQVWVYSKLWRDHPWVVVLAGAGVVWLVILAVQ